MDMVAVIFMTPTGARTYEGGVAEKEGFLMICSQLSMQNVYFPAMNNIIEVLGGGV